MTPLENFEKLVVDIDIISLPPQNHIRRKYIRKYIMTEDLIRYCIEHLNFSANYICNEIFSKKGYYTDASTIIDFCKEKNIKTKTIKESANSINVRTKYKETCLKKYNKINSLSKNTLPYLKRNCTVKNKYNVNNVFQLELVKEKSKQSMINKYGVNHTIFLHTTKRNYGKRSKIHKKIESFLTEHNVDFKSEVKNKFTKYNNYLNKDYSPIVDILIENKKIVIEINGDIWHANPKFYKNNDMIHRFKGLISAQDIWNFDKSRISQIESFGYTVIVLWECDINNNMELIKNILAQNKLIIK
jgi:G:T-mismatch repair DNA endonuclease (very short patch repair protein)